MISLTCEGHSIMGNGFFPVISAEEAVTGLKDGATVAFSGFTPAGTAKAVPRALAQKARDEHAKGKAFRVRAHQSEDQQRY